MESFMKALDAINGVLWHDLVLYVVLGVGVLFTLWSGFSQYRALTHGVNVIRGRYDRKDDPGAINHFQALSTALSGTVGLGNIAGVSVAVSLGGPGAIFWLWVVGFVGMALKLTEVTQSMMFRDVSDPDNPQGGPMWVCKNGLAKISPALAPLGWLLGAIFCVAVIIGAFTGGNMFQAWNVAKITATYVPSISSLVVGIFLTVLTAAVIIGGIKRIGSVTGRLVPLMCGLYFIAAIVILVLNVGAIPAVLKIIVLSGLPPALGGESANPEGAFLGGTFGYAFLWGMKRALFSNEAGQGSAPIAHSAAKTDEPVREGLVAGLEPFIDTLVVCTVTAMVVMVSGAWNRPAAATFASMPTMVQVGTADDGEGGVVPLWAPDTTELPAKPAAEAKISNVWRDNDELFVLVQGDVDPNTGRDLHRVMGEVEVHGEGDTLVIKWEPYKAVTAPTLAGPEVHLSLPGSSLTGYAFDRVIPGMGMWIVTLASWLFALSTIISWSYYGEQATIFLAGKRWVFPYKFVYCTAVLVACIPGFIKTDAELDSLTALGTGAMLWANIPIMLLFGPIAMRAYKDYIRRLDAGEMKGHSYPSITDVMEGKDVR